jgi:rhamnosyltransferase
MNRILYFVHYHKNNFLSEHVIYLLKNVRALYTRIVVISNSPLSAEQRKKLADFCDEMLGKTRALISGQGKMPY